MQNILPVNFVVIGYGHIGKRHADILRNHPNAKLVAIVDSNSNEQTAEDKDLLFFNSIKHLIDSSIDFDAAIIATPNGLHAEHAISCLNYGKHVVVEKPIAINTADAEKIYEAALLNSKKVFAVFQNRYSPISVWLKEILFTKKLGKIFMVQMNCFWNRDHRYYKKDGWHGTADMDGGSLYTQFSHYIDALYWFFGDIECVKSDLFNFRKQCHIDFEDSGFITFDLNDGGKGSFAFTTAVYGKNLESSLTVIGEDGTIKIGGQYMDQVLEVNAKDLTYPNFNDLITTNHQSFLYDVVKKIQNNHEPSISENEVLNVIGLIERMYQPATTEKL